MRNKGCGVCGWTSPEEEKSSIVVLWIRRCQRTCSISYARVSHPSTIALPIGWTTTFGKNVFLTRPTCTIGRTSIVTSTAPYATQCRWMSSTAIQPASPSDSCRFYVTLIRQHLRCFSTLRITTEAEQWVSRSPARKGSSTIRSHVNVDRFTALEMDRSSAMDVVCKRIRTK